MNEEKMKKILKVLLKEIAETTTIESSEDNTCARLVINLYESGSSRYAFENREDAEAFLDYFKAGLREGAM